MLLCEIVLCLLLVAVVKFCFAILFCACCLLLLLSYVLFCFAWWLLVLFVKLFLLVAVLNCLYCWVDAGFLLCELVLCLICYTVLVCFAGGLTRDDTYIKFRLYLQSFPRRFRGRNEKKTHVAGRRPANM